MNRLFSSFRPSTYDAGSVMLAHVHDHATFSLAMAGSYEETIRGRSGAHGPGERLVCLQYEHHAQRFGTTGAFKRVFTPTGDALARLRPAPLDQVRRRCEKNGAFAAQVFS